MRINVGSGSLVGTALGTLFPLVFFCVGGYALYEGALMWSSGAPVSMYAPWAGAGGTFIVVSCISIAATLRRRRKAQAVQTLKEKHADALWHIRPEWRSPTIRESNNSAWGLIAFAVLWNGFSWPMAGYAIYSEFITKVEAPQWGVLFMLLFPLAGLLVGWFALSQVLHRRKYGTTTLEMDTLPARLGRRLEARVQTNIDVGDAPDKDFHVRLTCYHRYVRYTTDSDGDRRKKVIKNRKWREEKHIRGRAYGTHNTLEVPVSFNLPPDAPASTPEKSEERMMWEIDVDADMPGIDYDVSFEVPVFPPEEDDVPRRSRAGSFSEEPFSEEPFSEEPFSEESFSEESAAQGALPSGESAPEDATPVEASAERESDPYARYEVETTYDAPVSDGITMSRLPGDGVRFDFAAGRNLTTGLMVVAFGVVFGGVGVALVMNASIFIGGIFAAVGGGLLYFAAWPMLMHSSTVSIQSGTVSHRKGAFGGGKTTTFPATELVDVRVDENGRSGETTMYALTLYRDDAAAEENAEATRENYERFVGFMRKSGLAGAKQRDENLDAVMSEIEERAGGLQVASGLTNKSEADWIASELVMAAERESAFA